MSAGVSSRIVLIGMPAGGTYRFADGTAAAPSIAFASDPDTGFYRISDNILGFAANGVASLRFPGGGNIRSASGVVLSLGTVDAGEGFGMDNNGAIYLTGRGTNQNITLTPSGTGKTLITANGLSVTAPQLQIQKTGVTHTLNVYSGTAGSVIAALNASSGFGIEFGASTTGSHTAQMMLNTAGNLLLGTITDSSNGRIQLATHTTSAGGIGFGTDVALYRLSPRELALDGLGGTSAILRWRESGSGVGSIESVSGVFQMGTSGATSFRLFTNNTVALTLDSSQNAMFAGGVQTTTYLQSGAGQVIGWSSRSRMFAPADGVILLQNNATTDFSRLQFGGTSASFPALARNAAALEVKLADNSDYAALDAKSVRLNGMARISAGSGTPEGAVALPVGSMFLRTDGGASTTLYVKESGTGNTGWVAK